MQFRKEEEGRGPQDPENRLAEIKAELQAFNPIYNVAFNKALVMLTNPSKTAKDLESHLESKKGPLPKEMHNKILYMLAFIWLCQEEIKTTKNKNFARKATAINPLLTKYYSELLEELKKEIVFEPTFENALEWAKDNLQQLTGQKLFKKLMGLYLPLADEQPLILPAYTHARKEIAERIGQYVNWYKKNQQGIQAEPPTKVLNQSFLSRVFGQAKAQNLIKFENFVEKNVQEFINHFENGDNALKLPMGPKEAMAAYVLYATGAEAPISISQFIARLFHDERLLQETKLRRYIVNIKLSAPIKDALIDYALSEESEAAAFMAKIIGDRKLLQEVLAKIEVSRWTDQALKNYKLVSPELKATTEIKYEESGLLAGWDKNKVNNLHSAFITAVNRREDFMHLNDRKVKSLEPARKIMIAYVVSALNENEPPSVSHFIRKMGEEEQARRETLAKEEVINWVKQALMNESKIRRGTTNNLHMAYSDSLLLDAWSKEKIHRVNSALEASLNNIKDFLRLDSKKHRSARGALGVMSDYVLLALDTEKLPSVLDYVNQIIEETKAPRVALIRKEIEKNVALLDSHTPKTFTDLIETLDESKGEAPTKIALIDYILDQEEVADTVTVAKLFANENLIRDAIARTELTQWVEKMFAEHQKYVEGAPIDTSLRPQALIAACGLKKAEELHALIRQVWTEMIKVNSLEGTQKAITDYMIAAIHSQALPPASQLLTKTFEDLKKSNREALIREKIGDWAKSSVDFKDDTPDKLREDGWEEDQINMIAKTFATASDSFWRLLRSLEENDRPSSVKTALVNYVLSTETASDKAVVRRLFENEKLMCEAITREVLSQWIEQIRRDDGKQRKIKAVPKKMPPNAYKDEVLLQVWGTELTDKIYAAFDNILTYTQRWMYSQLFKNKKLPVSEQVINEAIINYVLSAIDSQEQPSARQFIHEAIANQGERAAETKASSSLAVHTHFNQSAKPKKPKTSENYRRLGGPSNK